MNTIRFQKPSFPVNHFFDEMLKEFAQPAKVKASKRVAVNVSETEEQFLLEMSVPGYDKEQIKISTNEGILKIKAEVEEKNYSNYTRKEFSVTAFENSYKLPEEIDVDHITANFKNGILKIELKKLVREEVKRNIEINIQ